MAQNTRKYLSCNQRPGTIRTGGMKKAAVVFLVGMLLALFAVGALAAADPADSGYAPRNAASLSTEAETAIKNGILNCTEIIDLSSCNLPNTEEVQQQVHAYVFNGSPLFFNVNSWAPSLGSTLNAIKITYKHDAAEFKTMVDKINAVVDDMLNGILGNDSLGAVEKALLIHDRLALRCEFSNTADDAETIYGALVGRKAQCVGYAKAYWYLLDQVGIKSELVESLALDHMWNIVYINGKPYHVDVTWDDPDVDVTGWVTHDTFLLSSNGIFKSGHSAADYNTVPADTTYDNWFWKDSQTSFVLLGTDLYYINNGKGTLNRYSDRKTLLTINAVWPDYKNPGSYYAIKLVRLCTDGKDLLYNTTKDLICYNVSTGAVRTVHTFPAASKSVVGFTYEDGWLIGEYTANANYSAVTKANDGFRIQYVPSEDPIEPGIPDNLGDVDGNGKVESADARLALRASVKLEPTIVEGSDAFKAADVNGNKTVGSDDARTILRLSVKLENIEEIKAKYGK